MATLGYSNAFFKTTDPSLIERAQLLTEVTPLSSIGFSSPALALRRTIQLFAFVRRYFDILCKPEKKVIMTRKKG